MAFPVSFKGESLDNRLGSETQFDLWLVETFLKILPEWLQIQAHLPEKTRQTA